LTIRNDAEGETYGAELSATYQMLDWWRLTAGYTYLEVDLRERSGRTDVNRGKTDSADPQQWASLRSSMNLPGHLEFDLGGRWVDTVHNISNGVRGTVPSYFELEARLGWHPHDDWEISIVGQNLLDDQHPEMGFPNANRHQIERSVYGKVTWQF
jgi:iron complex outermembrane recepter protein